jgi:hypothetical protein
MPSLHQSVVNLLGERAFFLPCTVNVRLPSVRVTAVGQVVNAFKAINPAGATLNPFKRQGVLPDGADRRFFCRKRFNLAS